MNTKSNLNLIRGILYVHEVARCKSISKAAEENNIKTPNLSLIVKNLEKEIGTPLFKRTSSGCTPTTKGRQICQIASEIQTQIQRLCDGEIKNRHVLNVYVAPTMKLADCTDFEAKHPEIDLNFIEDEILADVRIDNQPPKDKNETYTELNIGGRLMQKVWICFNDQNSRALKFFDFIVAKLLP